MIAQLLRENEHFDVAHQLAPLALRYPSPLRHFDVPYVIGPLAGSLSTPESFAHEFGNEPWYVRLRSLDGLRLRYDRTLRASYQRAEVVFGAAPYVSDILQPLGLRRFEVISETGVAAVSGRSDSRDHRALTLHLLFVGRLVRSKGAIDAIRAIGLVRDRACVHLDVVGDGPERAACEREIRRLALSNEVTLHGRLPRERVEEFYRCSHLLLFPSFREPSGNVVIEAMSHGLAVIVADRGGPAEAVGGTGGVKVAVTNPEQFAHDLAESILRYHRDREALKADGESARQRVMNRFLWDKKIEFVEAIYGDVASLRRPRSIKAPSHMQQDY